MNPKPNSLGVFAEFPVLWLPPPLHHCDSSVIQFTYLTAEGTGEVQQGGIRARKFTQRPRDGTIPPVAAVTFASTPALPRERPLRECLPPGA